MVVLKLKIRGGQLKISFWSVRGQFLPLGKNASINKLKPDLFTLVSSANY